jgi:hypothetical protein
MKRLVLIAPLIALAVACGQQPKVEIGNPTQLGTVDLALGGQLKTQATYISDETQIAITPLAGGYISDSKRNAKYIWGRFQVKNTTGAALNNLTFYALNKSGNNGGTAIKSMTNFVGAATADDAARAAQPGHAMLQGTGAATVDGTNANLQLFTASEVSALGVPAGTGTVLEYGYKVNAASIPDGDTSVVTLSYKIPFASTSTSFTATFAIAKDGPNRVSQSAEENPSDVDTRVGTATEIAYLGPKGQNTTGVVAPAGVTAVRLANPKTAVGTDAYLLADYTFASFNTAKPDQGGYVSSYSYNPYIDFGASTTINSRTAPEPNTVKLTTTAAQTGGTGLVHEAYPFGSFSQNISKYKKLNVFVDKNSSTFTGISVLSSTGPTEIKYYIGFEGPNTYPVVLATPAECTTPSNTGPCDLAQLPTLLSTVTGVKMNSGASVGAGTSIEIGNIFFSEYTP